MEEFKLVPHYWVQRQAALDLMRHTPEEIHERFYMVDLASPGAGWKKPFALSEFSPSPPDTRATATMTGWRDDGAIIMVLIHCEGTLKYERALGRVRALIEEAYWKLLSFTNCECKREKLCEVHEGWDVVIVREK